MKTKTCGECRIYDHFHNLCVIGGDIEPTETAKGCFEPKVSTNGDKIRQCNNRELAEISIYEDTMSDGVIVYRSTLIVDKFFLTKNCAVSVVEAWLNAPAESEEKDETR